MYEIVFFELPSGRKPVWDYIKDVDERARGRLLAAIDVLREDGTIQEPRSRAIVGVPKLRELRVSHARGISRIFYSVEPGPCFVLLHGFTKKTQKTPRHEIELAVARMKQYRETRHG